MDKIKETDKIKRLVKLSELSKSIVAKIQAMPEVNELKFDLDIILYVCELIENNIVIGILQKCHPFTPPELLILNKITIIFYYQRHISFNFYQITIIVEEKTLDSLKKFIEY